MKFGPGDALGPGDILGPGDTLGPGDDDGNRTPRSAEHKTDTTKCPKIKRSFFLL